MSAQFIIVIFILMLVGAFPLRNWLEIRLIKKKEKEWAKWLKEKPSYIEYCDKNPTESGIQCNFCGSNRQVSKLETVIPYKPKFGIINNKTEKNSYYRTCICSGCGSQLYRERQEK
ncbi:hypothetical protein MCEREM21_00132 [Burkholderiaceae bacterium]